MTEAFGEPNGLDETAERGAPLGVVGPRSLSGPAGTKVRARWALAAGPVEEGVRVEWISEGRVLSQEESVAAIEFDLDGARAGDVLWRSIRAVLRGPDWSLELPALAVEITVGG